MLNNTRIRHMSDDFARFRCGESCEGDPMFQIRLHPHFDVLQ